MNRGIFITGTGTDVGKTYISGLLAKKCKSEGLRVGYFKAAVSGNEREDGKLVPMDALFVKSIAGLEQDLDSMVPYIYEVAYSPHLAARLEGNPVELSVVEQAFAKCQESYEFIIAEGSGGIVCPIAIGEEEIWLTDVIDMTGYDTVIVADAGLGTINSVVLTVNYMKQKGIKIRGIILNHFEKENIMHEDNLQMIEQVTKIPVIARVSEGDIELQMDLGKIL